MASNLNAQEANLMDKAFGNLLKKMKDEWPSHSAITECFQHYVPDSPNGQTVVQVQIRIVTDETDFLPDFTTEFINNHNPKS